MKTFFILLTPFLILGCGVKGPPRPPLAETPEQVDQSESSQKKEPSAKQDSK